MFLQKTSRASGWPPLSRPVNTTSLGHTIFGMSHPYATAFQAAELCLGQGFAKYGPYAIREQPLWMFPQKTSRASGWPPVFGTFPVGKRPYKKPRRTFRAAGSFAPHKINSNFYAAS